MTVGRFTVAGLLAAASLASTASGHGTVQPTLAEAGETREFVFTIGNARQDAEIVGVVVKLPGGASLERAAAQQPRWSATASGRRVTWEGGPIPPLASESFALTARMPDREGQADFLGQELYDDGPGPPFPLQVTIAGSAASEDAASRPQLALVLAGIAVLLSSAVLAIALARRSRRHGTE